MKVLHITPSYKPAYIYGGPTLSVSRLAEALQVSGVDVSVFTTTANGKEELDIDCNITLSVQNVLCVYFSRWTGDHSHFSPYLLWRLMTIEKKDMVFHIHSWWNLVVIPSVLICWIRGIKPIISPRGMLSDYSFNSRMKRLFHYTIGKWLLKNTILHVTSEIELKDSLRFIPNWPYFILPNIIDFPELKGNLIRENTTNYIRIVMLSRIHPVKNIELFFHGLKGVSFEYTVEIIGDGDSEYVNTLKLLAKDLSISTSIEWKGWLEGNEKSSILFNSDIFVLTSYNENFSNAALESLSLGTPVLLTKAVGLSDYVQKTGFGFVCEPDAASISEALNIFSVTKSLFSRDTITKKVREDFGVQNITKQYIEKYHQFQSK